jgi:hypothetical protein
MRHSKYRIVLRAKMRDQRSADRASRARKEYLHGAILAHPSACRIRKEWKKVQELQKFRSSRSSGVAE